MVYVKLAALGESCLWDDILIVGSFTPFSHGSSLGKVTEVLWMLS